MSPSRMRCNWMRSVALRDAGFLAARWTMSSCAGVSRSTGIPGGASSGFANSADPSVRSFAASVRLKVTMSAFFEGSADSCSFARRSSALASL